MLHLLSDGGYDFMIPLLITLIISITLIVKGLKNNTKKNLQLLKSIGLFALVFGFLGFTLGLISRLDIIPKATSISGGVLATGIKFMVLPPAFGMFIFLVGRAGIIGLLSIKKKR